MLNGMPPLPLLYLLPQTAPPPPPPFTSFTSAVPMAMLEIWIPYPLTPPSPSAVPMAMLEIWIPVQCALCSRRSWRRGSRRS